jgi:hypothetical protein
MSLSSPRFSTRRDSFDERCRRHSLTAACLALVFSGSAFAVPLQGLTVIDFPGAAETRVEGLHGSQLFGWYRETGTDRAKGFVWDGTSWTSIVAPWAYEGAFAGTYVLAMSGSTIAGWYDTNTTNGRQGFYYDGTTYHQVQYPGSQQTWLTAISGSTFYGNTASWQPAFSFDGISFTDLELGGRNEVRAVSGGNLLTYNPMTGVSSVVDGMSSVTITYPGAIATDSYGYDGVNVVGVVTNSNYSGTGFLFDGTTFTLLDDINGSTVYARGVQGNTVVGFYSDVSKQGYVGFIATVPEPSTYAMALAGIACGGFSMWRRRKRA